jgi:hypothetical protein
MTPEKMIALIFGTGIIIIAISLFIHGRVFRFSKHRGVPKMPNPPPMPEPFFVQVKGISELYTYSEYKKMLWFYDESDIVAVWRKKKKHSGDRGNSNISPKRIY